MAGVNGMSNMSMMGNTGTTRGYGMRRDLIADLNETMNESLSWAVVTTFIAAVLASYFISRRVVAPVQKMMVISHRIADGDYGERLKVSGETNADQLDELDQLALSFNQMAEQLDQTETMRRQLIGDVSHELRTPLTAIKGYMEGLIDGVLPPNAETFQQVHSEADRLQRLVNDLQELSRVEAGAYTLNIKPVSVYELIEKLVSHLNLQFKEKGVLLESTLPLGLPLLNADEDRVLQVLINLAGNALQYTPAGGKVRISAVKEKGEVEMIVSDSGVGITPEHLPHIFNRFYRVDKSRARVSGGSGVGLTVAQSLVKAHGGRIWVNSEGKGKGSSFHFTLPAVL